MNPNTKDDANDVRLILIENFHCYRSKRGIGELSKRVEVSFYDDLSSSCLFTRECNLSNGGKLISFRKYQSLDDNTSIVVVLVVVLPRRSLRHRKFDPSSLSGNCMGHI